MAQATTDVSVVVLALSIGHVAPHGRTAGNWIVVLFVIAVVWLGVFSMFGLYSAAMLPPWDEFRRTIGAATVAILIIVTAILLWRPNVPHSSLAIFWVAVLFLELFARRMWRWVGWQLKKRGVLVLRTLIVGTGPEAAAIAASLTRVPTGLAPMGHIDASEQPASRHFDGVGGVHELQQLVVDRGIDCVLVASGEVSRETLLDVCRACRRANVEMRVSANLPEILPSRMVVDSVADVLTIAIQPPRLVGFRAALKRGFDVVVASMAFVLLSPVMLAVWMLVLTTSGRPALFHQDRFTKDLTTFRLHKFRTMIADADSAAEDLRPLLAEPFFKMEDDPRITKCGRALRRFSLDELPQLWNVIRGDMSLVGPRPLRVEQVTENNSMLASRHEVKAGLTGWWQIRGRSDVESSEALKMDAFYIQNWSLALDIYILLKTIPTLIRAKGAY
jgi:exopolysaccharide biosynthesis polyprenyl glycosylphosphotransferase